MTGLVLALCLLTAGCDQDTGKNSESTAEAPSQAASAEVTKQTEQTEKTEQTETTTTADSTAAEGPEDATPEEAEMHILDLNKRTTFEYRWDDETAKPLVECKYTAALLGSEAAERYPELAAVLTATACAEENSLKSEFQTLSEAVDEMTAMDMELSGPLASKLDAQVRRADSVVLSVVTDCRYNNGMNGGHRSFWGSNYDTETGRTLHLPDVVTDMDAFAKAVEEKLFGEFGAELFYRDDIIREYFEMYGADGTHWSLDYNGVTVYFDSGEITSEGVGAMNVTMTFAEYPELFSEKYTAVPDAYIVSLPMKSAFCTDLDGDGKCEELSICDSYDEENDYYATVDIFIGEASYTEDMWAYSFEPYYVKTAEGRHLLYLFTELETQMYLYVYDIAGGAISKVGEADLSPYYSDGVSALLTDPDRMHFDIFSDEAGGGVSEGNDIFSAGVDGMPAQG